MARKIKYNITFKKFELHVRMWALVELYIECPSFLVFLDYDKHLVLMFSRYLAFDQMKC